MNTEQTVINLLSTGDVDDLLWTWLIEQVELIVSKEPFEKKKILQDGAFESSMELDFKENRIYVSMNSFGYGLQYSWELCHDHEDDVYLGNFQIENTPFEEGGIDYGSKEQSHVC